MRLSPWKGKHREFDTKRHDQAVKPKKSAAISCSFVTMYASGSVDTHTLHAPFFPSATSYHSRLTQRMSAAAIVENHKTVGTVPKVEEIRRPSFACDFLAGGLATVAAKTVMAPVERVKLLLQVQYIHIDIPPEARYNGLLDCLRRVYQEQGILSFWRGNTVNVIRHIPTQALNFALKERFRSLYLDGVPIEHFWTYLSLSLLSGASSGAVSLAVLYPLDFARTRLGTDVRASGKLQFRGSIDCLRQTYSAEGLRGIYRGFDIAFVGAVTWRALYFGFYDTLTTHLLGGRQGGTLHERWAVAQVVTSASGTLVYPIDTVRRRMMMEAGRSERVYTNSLHCAQTILAKEGWRGFFRGLSANLLRGVGTSALLVLYDEIRKLFPRT